VASTTRETHAKSDAKAFARERLQGIITAICTPEKEGRIDEEGLRHDVRHCIDVLRSGGLYIHGFYANFWLLTREERRLVLEIVVDETAGAVPIICRCAHPSLEEAIGLVQHADAAGADMISMLGPWHGQASDEMVYRWFELIAAQTDLGITVFNTAQAGYVISPDLLARIAEIPNIAALKNHMPPEHTNEVRRLVGDEIVVIDPEEERFLTSMLVHGQRAIYTGTNMMFDSAQATPMRDYVQAGLVGNGVAATELYERMQPIRDLHHEWVISPWAHTGLCPIATVKAWSQQLGMTGGEIRRPLPTLSEADRARLIEGIHSVGLR
jgi:4-hydroxy-tetrahydrodipicolinate synthase